MRESKRNYLFAGSIAAAFLVALVILYYAARSDPAGIWGQTTAAWLQALGSILAILTAIMVASLQLRHAALEAHREKAERAQSAALLAHRSLELAGDRLKVAARPRSKRTYGLELREHRTSELIDVLRQISPGDLATEAVVPFSTLRTNLYAVNKRISEIYRSEEEKGKTEAARETRLASSFIIFENAASDYRDLCAVLRRAYALKLPKYQPPPELQDFIRAAKARRQAKLSTAVQPQADDKSKQAPARKSKPRRRRSDV